MAFGRFQFKKLWTSPTDFPTIEVDEAQVRADMQALHDESKDGLNQLMTELENSDAAGNLGAKTLDTGEDSNVQEVMAALRGEMQDGYEDLDKDRHTHKNSTVLENITVALTDTLAAAYNRVVTLLNGITGVVTTLGNDHSTIPTSKAVSDALTQAGNLPAAGAAGEVLMKGSSANFDVRWDAVDLSNKQDVLTGAPGQMLGFNVQGMAVAQDIPNTDPNMTVVTLSAAGWDASNKTQSATVNGILADETKQLIQCTPAGASMAAAAEAGVYCSAQRTNSLTFTCAEVPAEQIQICVSWQNANYI